MIAPDLRGRARSDKPAIGYTMADHARDVIGLMDHARHRARGARRDTRSADTSAIYLAAHFPGSVRAADRHRRGDHVASARGRADQAVARSPGQDAAVGRARISRRSRPRRISTASGTRTSRRTIARSWCSNADGTAQSSTSASAIAQAAYGLACEPWLHLAQQVRHPTLLINALEPYGPPGTPPLMEETWARATASAFPRWTLRRGARATTSRCCLRDGAAAMAREIERFARPS